MKDEYEKVRRVLLASVCNKWQRCLIGNSLEHHAHELELYSVHCGHIVKYFEKGYNVKRALLLKAHAGACAQGEGCRERKQGGQ